GRMTVPQIPAANAASSTTKRRTATVRCETNLVPAIPLPVEPDLGIGPQVVAGEDPLAAASLAREVGSRLGRRPEADEQDEDSYPAAQTAKEHLAGNIEHVGDAGADVVRGVLGEMRLLLREILRRRRRDRKSTRLNSSHDQISYAVFCLKKKKKKN